MRVLGLVVLVIGLALRAVHLGAPLLGIHDWRQADTAAVARNFYRDGIDLARPTIDWRGATSGVVEMEFPLYPATVAVLYEVTGPNLGVARAVAAAASIVTMLALFALVRRWTGDRRVALLSAAIWFLLPYNIYFTRAIMPESWMLAAMTLGALLFDVWAESPRRWWAFVGSAVAIALAGLIKLPALHVGLLLGAILWWRQPGARAWLRLSPALVLYAVATLLPSMLWYRHAADLRAETGLSFGISASGKWADWRPLLNWEFYNGLIFQHLAEKHFTWAGLPLVVAGIVVAWRRGANGRIVLAWCGAVIAFFLIATVGVWVHEYYQLPLVLPASILMALAIDAGWRSANVNWRRTTIVLTAALMILAIGRLPLIWRHENPEGSSKIALANALFERTKPDDLVVVLDAGNPTVLYLADRKGWSTRGTDRAPETGLDRFIEQGAVLIGLRRERFSGPDERTWLDAMLEAYEVVYQDESIVLVR